MAVIYKKESSRPLSKYQLKMNDAAIQLRLQNPGLLRKKRKVLMDAARDKIIADGFQFAKGKSRSKSLTPEAAEPKPKRQKLTQDVREKRLKDIEEDMTDLKERIQFKEGRISGYLAIADYKKCDEIKEETIQLKKQLRELEAEKKHLAVSSRQSKWYYKNKRSSSDSGAEHSTLSCSDTDLQGHTPTPAPSPSSNASFNESILASDTPETLSPGFPASQFPLFSQSQHYRGDADTTDLESNDSDVQIVAEAPDGDGALADLSTPPGTQPSSSFLAHPPAAPPLQEDL